MKYLVAALALSACGLVSAASGWSEDLDRALETARRTGQPVLIDFYAPWCYSCYFMDQKVLETEAFAARSTRLIGVKVDVDTPTGAAARDLRKVRVLPSYILLDPAGHERDRIIGEQSAEDFFAWLDRNLSGPRPAAAATPADAVAALEADVRRATYAAGLSWLAAQPDSMQAAVAADPAGAAAIARLRLMQASAAGDAEQCMSRLPAAFESARACDRAGVVYDAKRCLGEGDAARKQALSAYIAPRLADVVVAQVWVEPARRCADARSPVQLAAAAYAELGEPAKAAELYDGTIEMLRAELGPDVGADRNLADNLRLFLELSGRTEELLALFPRLIAAYPQDYVYADRYGRVLVGLGRLDEAVEQYARAAESAYGINRLRLADRHADALVALGRKDEARAMLRGVLKQNGKWFAEEAGKLRGKLRSL